MSLLDADADEMKKKAQENPGAGTGRKVGMSGLGAFKGISKYSNLTAKYRKPETTTNAAATPIVTPAPIVVQAPVPTPIEIKNEVAPPLVNEKELVQTVEVQTTSEVITSPSPTLVEQSRGTSQSEVSAMSVQSPSEVSADIFIQSHGEVSAKNDEVHAKQVQSPSEVSAKLSIKDDLTEALSQCEVPAKSVQCNSSLESKPILLFNENTSTVDNSHSIVIAKSVQENIEVSAKPVQSQFKVPAKSVHQIPVIENIVSVQSPSEVSAIQMQSDFKLDAKPLQSESKLSSDVSAKSVQSQSNVGSNVHSKLVRRSDELVPLENVVSISGAQRVVLEFLFEQCIWNNSLATPPITKQQLLTATQLVEDTALSSIRRLRLKQIIDRVAYKDGKAGWSQYQLSEKIYRELLYLKQNEPKSLQTQFKVSPIVSATVSANPSSKIDSNINNNTNLHTNDGLDEIDFSSLEAFSITKSVIFDFRKNKWEISRSMLESHIERFAKWASESKNTNSIRNLRGLFCSNIQKIVETGHDPFDFIKTDSDVMLDSLLAKRKAHLEEMKRKKDELFEIEFETWEISHSDDSLMNLVPQNQFAHFGTPQYRALLKEYFRVNKPANQF
jgi:hypothetical protein